MCVTRITVQQTRSATRRHRKQRQTLIGLKLNRIGRIAELPDTLQTLRHDRQGRASCAHHRPGDRA